MGLKFWPSRIWSFDPMESTRDGVFVYSRVLVSTMSSFSRLSLLGRLFLGRRSLGCRFPGRRFMGCGCSFFRSSFCRHPWYNGRGQPHKIHIFTFFSCYFSLSGRRWKSHGVVRCIQGWKTASWGNRSQNVESWVLIHRRFRVIYSGCL